MVVLVGCARPTGGSIPPSSSSAPVTTDEVAGSIDDDRSWVFVAMGVDTNPLPDAAPCIGYTGSDRRTAARQAPSVHRASAGRR
jgi:hypothetical protein